MDLLLAIKVIILGIVEGLTEFLPISSTGHLILAGSLLDFTGEKAKVFEIVIQAGAIFAVCIEYRKRISSVVFGLSHDQKARQFAMNVIIGFLPAALMGLIFSKAIKAYLFTPVSVAMAFIIGGFIILWMENRPSAKNEHLARIQSIDDMSPLDALKVGCAQILALVPGTSRSGASIIGGMFLGLSRKAATEFSFFLAIPTLLGATVYSLYKARHDLVMSDVPLFSLGTVSAFISAYFCVRWLLRYISTHDFKIFAWYRIAFGCMILITAYTDTIVWAD